MNILKQLPPNYELITRYFPAVKASKSVIFTYGDTIYCPHASPNDLPKDLIAHEVQHTLQQKKLGADAWWNKYCSDVEFRLSQELEAYQVQYAFARDNYGRDYRKAVLNKISKDLSSPIYGKLVSKKDARSLILGDV